MTASLAGLPPADQRATVESALLAIVSEHGGQRIVAGPPMEAMVGKLTAQVLAWLGESDPGPGTVVRR